MKKNLAKRIVLGLLTGAVLMSSSVAWAEEGKGYNLDVDQSGLGSKDFATDSLSIGGSVYKANAGEGGARSTAIGVDSNIGDVNNQYVNDSVAVGYKAYVTKAGSVALGSNAQTAATNSMALGFSAVANASGSVALGSGSQANKQDVVSVGYGGASGGVYDIDSDPIITNNVPNTRSIINVTDVIHAAYGSSTDKKFAALYSDETKKGNYGSYVVNLNTLCDALSGYYTKAEIDQKIQGNGGAGGNGGNYVKTEDVVSGGKETAIGNLSVQESASGSVTLSAGTGEDTSAVVTFEKDKVVFGTNSSWYQEAEGFFAGGNANHEVSSAKAALKEDGSLMGASGAFQVDTSGNVIANNLYNKTQTEALLNTKANAADVYKKTETYSQDEVNTRLAGKADKSALDAEIDERKAADQDLQSQIDNIGGGAIAGLNQRLEKTNAKINKVGAGAAALAALHPLDYDPDDKLTFSAGMGNYAGENAAALGAFYRPNEKFMVSLGGTMGNGENMVNLGLSIGLDKPNGFAKMSKRELIQEVNAVKAENEAMKDQLANADERIAKLEALVAQLVAK